MAAGDPRFLVVAYEGLLTGGLRDLGECLDLDLVHHAHDLRPPDPRPSVPVGRDVEGTWRELMAHTPDFETDRVENR